MTKRKRARIALTGLIKDCTHKRHTGGRIQPAPLRRKLLAIRKLLREDDG
jgi:hypothetical protein